MEIDVVTTPHRLVMATRFHRTTPCGTAPSLNKRMSMLRRCYTRHALSTVRAFPSCSPAPYLKMLHTHTYYTTALLQKKTTSAACRGDPQDGAGSAPRASEGLRLTALVVWFRSFLTILDEEAVGGGGDGLWGSRPARLLKVIDQRVGCAQEAVQLVRKRKNRVGGLGRGEWSGLLS